MKNYENYKRKGFWINLEICQMLSELSEDYRSNETLTIEELIKKEYSRKNNKDENKNKNN